MLIVLKRLIKKLHWELNWLLQQMEMCRKAEVSFLIAQFRKLYFKLRGKNIYACNGVRIRGLSNIHTETRLQIGMNYVGFMNRNDLTYLNVAGKLKFNGDYRIGKGCRFDIDKNAVAEFGYGSITANTTFIIVHGLKVGDGCAISWGCQFLDEDFHEVQYAGKVSKPHPIEIGDHVWIGCNVTVLKGSKIPDGCVVASGSVVRSRFETKNALIAGNPAKVIKEDVTWN